MNSHLTMCIVPGRAVWMGWQSALRRASGLLLSSLALLCAAPVRAEAISLTHFEVARGEEGILLSFTASLLLPENVEGALVKGTPLYFSAEANIFRSRWYWRDRRVAHAVHGWRLTYQPLTRKYRVSTGGLNQSYDTLKEALARLRHSVHWKIADADQLREGSRHYIEFSFRLDTTKLPRPMQIGIGRQAGWALVVEREQRID